MTIPSPLAVLRKIFKPSGGRAKTPADKEGSIGLYGLSKVGKTVFLSVLFREATLDAWRSGRFKLLTRHQETLREMVRNRELLEGRSELGRPAFPPPTQVSRLFHFDAIVGKRRLFPFRTMDYKGEGLDWTRTSGSTETIEFLSSCHCLLFLYEPDEQMLDRGGSDLDVAEPERMRRIELFTTMIANLRKSDRKVKLNMPIGLLITKADLLEGFNSLSEEDTILLNRRLINAKFTDPQDFIAKVLQQPHIQNNGPWQRQVRRILTGLTLFWDEVLNSAPIFQVFFVSSTGGTDTITNERGEQEVVPLPAFRPKGVLAPFHWVVDMLETRQRARAWHHFTIRWVLIPTLVLQVFLAGLHLWMHEIDLPRKENAIRNSPTGTTFDTEKKWPYGVFFPGIHKRLVSMKAARTVENYLLELFARSARPQLDPPPTDKVMVNRPSEYKTWPSQTLYTEIRAFKKDVPELASNIDAALLRLDSTLRDAVYRTINKMRSSPLWKEDPIGRAKAVYDHFALDGPAGNQLAADWYNGIKVKREETQIGELRAAVDQLARSQNVADRVKLQSKLEQLQGRLEGASESVMPPEERQRIAELSLLLANVDGMSEAEAKAHEDNYPIIAAIVAARSGEAAGGGDPEYLDLKTWMDSDGEDPVLYYDEGSRRARAYLTNTSDRADAETVRNRGTVDRWLRDITRWQTNGLIVTVRVTQAGIFPKFFEMRGTGSPSDQPRGPYSIGQDVEVLWTLSKPPLRGDKGVRLYFSPSGNRPSESDLGKRLVILGLRELLGGQPVSVGESGAIVKATLIGSGSLPVLGGRAATQRQ